MSRVASREDALATATVIELLADHPECVPALARLHFEEWSWLRPGETLAEREQRLRNCCGRQGIPAAMIAMTGGELSGSALLVSSDMDGRPELGPWLAGVYVVPALRRCGLGARLIRHMEREAAQRGIGELFLYTPAAEGYYARLGWSLLEHCEYRSSRVALMHKRLPGQRHVS